LNNEAIFFLQVFIVLGCVILAARLGQIWLVALMSAMLVLMNIFVLKQMNLFGMALTGGNVLYAAVFLTTDVLTEHWGERAAYRAVRIGFCVSVFFVATSSLILWYAPNAYDAEAAFGGHEALARILKPQWRIVGASMASYLVVQHLDVWLYEWWRARTRGRFLWLRNNGSTWVSQGVDSVLFTVLAFAGSGILPMETMVNMIVFTYILKIIVATLDTPFIYLSKTPLLRPRDAEAR